MAERFQPGDRVRVTGSRYGHCFPIGTLVTVQEHVLTSVYCEGEHRQQIVPQTLHPGDLELVEPENPITEEEIQMAIRSILGDSP